MLSAEKHQQKIFLKFKLKSWILQSILEPVDVADKKIGVWRITSFR